jgi:hypothetical protein
MDKVKLSHHLGEDKALLAAGALGVINFIMIFSRIKIREF